MSGASARGGHLACAALSEGGRQGQIAAWTWTALWKFDSLRRLGFQLGSSLFFPPPRKQSKGFRRLRLTRHSQITDSPRQSLGVELLVCRSVFVKSCCECRMARQIWLPKSGQMAFWFHGWRIPHVRFQTCSSLCVEHGELTAQALVHNNGASKKGMRASQCLHVFCFLVFANFKKAGSCWLVYSQFSRAMVLFW